MGCSAWKAAGGGMAAGAAGEQETYKPAIICQAAAVSSEEGHPHAEEVALLSIDKGGGAAAAVPPLAATAPATVEEDGSGAALWQSDEEVATGESSPLVPLDAAGMAEPQEGSAHSRRALELSALVAGTVLLGAVDVARNEVGYDPTRRMHYLTSAGLGYAAWVIWVLGLLDPGVFTAAPDLVLSSASEEALSGTRLDRALGGGRVLAGARVWRLVLAAMRCGLNVAMALQRFVDLPPREPGQLSNEARHAAGWVELMAAVQLVSVLFGCHRINKWTVAGTLFELIIIVAWFVSAAVFLFVRSSKSFAAVFLSLLLLLAFCTCPRSCHSVAERLREVARYSILGSLTLLSPASLNSRWLYMEHAGLVRLLMMAVIVPFYAVVAALSLVAKLVQVAFVATWAPAEWRVVDWLNLLAFANSLFGLVDQDALVRRGLFEQLRAQEEEEELEGSRAARHGAEAWLLALGEHLQRRYGPASAVCLMATLAPEEAAQLMRRG